MRRSVSNSPNTLLDIQRALQAKRLAEVLAADETESETQQQETVTTKKEKKKTFLSFAFFFVFSGVLRPLRPKKKKRKKKRKHFIQVAHHQITDPSKDLL